MHSNLSPPSTALDHLLSTSDTDPIDLVGIPGHYSPGELDEETKALIALCDTWRELYEATERKLQELQRCRSAEFIDARQRGFSERPQVEESPQPHRGSNSRRQPRM